MSGNQLFVDTYWRSLNKTGEELCGDRVQVRRGEDCVVLVLADGLGSGVKANILSTLTSTIIAEMIVQGMSLTESVDTIIKTLPVCRERGISYSTFTILQIYYDGRAFIAEFDNPAVVCMHDGRVFHPDRLERDIQGRRGFLSALDAVEGDRFVAFSDGVLHAGVGMMLNFGWDQKDVEKFLEEHVRPTDPPAEISRILLANVNYLYEGKPQDDSTVACINVEAALETRVMVGPPLNREEDVLVVNRLMAATGKKICCGGTTSEIVARQLHTEVKTDPVDLMNLDAHVPPKGYIEGVDLVTEGVLTLQKAARYIARAASDASYMEFFLLTKETDGAALLAKTLLTSRWIRFLVGTSDNPAHNAINYSPISLNAKISLIREMCEDLKKTGRIVHIEMY